MSAHEFTLPVSDLDAGGRAFAFVVRPPWIRGALEDQGDREGPGASENPGALAVRASKSGHDIVVHGTLDATVTVSCARCLDAFAMPVHSDIRVLYVLASRMKSKGRDSEDDVPLTEEESDTFPYDGDTVVLDDLVRDELLLAIPMIPLCREACPGMSPAPGSKPKAKEDKPVDPRLAPLLELRNRGTKT